MKIKLLSAIIIIFVITNAIKAIAQTISKEELIFLTSEWKGERFPDGRPKVSDDLIRRVVRGLVVLGVDPVHAPAAHHGPAERPRPRVVRLAVALDAPVDPL